MGDSVDSFPREGMQGQEMVVVCAYHHINPCLVLYHHWCKCGPEGLVSHWPLLSSFPQCRETSSPGRLGLNAPADWLNGYKTRHIYMLSIRDPHQI